MTMLRVQPVSASANARALPGVKPAIAGGDRSNRLHEQKARGDRSYRLHAQKALLEYLVCGRVNV
jgi:hypothetical protein